MISVPPVQKIALLITSLNNTPQLGVCLHRSVLRVVGGLPGSGRRQCSSDVLGRLLRPLRLVHVCQEHLQARLQAVG